MFEPLDDSLRKIARGTGIALLLEIEKRSVINTAPIKKILSKFV